MKKDKADSRRDFIKKSALGLSALGLSCNMPSFAGPFSYDQEGHLIPADKKLSAAWIKSLYERGVPEVYTGDQLRYIGMPVGGIACGQLYIGGDGKLWLWHIFKINYKRRADSQLLTRMEQGGHYAYPEEAFKLEERPVAQGTAVRVVHKGKTIIKELCQKDFDVVSFRGEYPISKIEYAAKDFPLSINLEAFSPFIPGELEKSANPCTIFSYKLKNTADTTLKVDMASWLENAVNPYDVDPNKGHRLSQLVATANRKTLMFSSRSSGAAGVENLEEQLGYGSMGLSLLDPSTNSTHVLAIDGQASATTIFSALDNSKEQTTATTALNHKKLAALLDTVVLKPGEEKEINFVLSWYFPHLNKIDSSWDVGGITNIKNLKLHYANRFASADEVAAYICDNFAALAGKTRAWNQTWYNATLPHWLLDRVFIALNCMATNTVVWLNNNRLWAWEGVDCCPGTCTHVWQYAQALAHIFPEAERNFREVTDLSPLGLNADGSLRHRAEHATEVAHDGHCGTIMRLFREHKKSADATFLKENYPNIKRMVHYIIGQDKDRNGLLEGKQQNTLDAAWYGPMGWISSLYLGALAAGKQMALEMEDAVLAADCDQLLVRGRKHILSLYNGEYFIHKPDPNYPDAISSNDGCHIDQVLGQSFGHMVGLPERVVPKKETVAALNAIWKYNFAPDAFDYQLKHTVIKGPRIYATQGEAATIMCTWPNGGDDKAVPGMADREQFPEIWSGPGIYFDEAMNGFEYQVAAHMVYEGLLEKGLATAKAVHDRYNAAKRNPFNEVECSDHYSRSMASFAVFLAVCGYNYHGPKGELSFNPQLTPADFKAPFTVAKGWGSFSQSRKDGQQKNIITIGHGALALNVLNLTLPEGTLPSSATLKINGQGVKAQMVVGSQGQFSWKMNLQLKAGDLLASTINF